LDNVRKAILSGYPNKIARKTGNRGIYHSPEGTEVYIHPRSTLFRHMPSCVVYHQIKRTNRSHMKVLTAIDPSWQQIFRF
jgi:hypothetical protein